MTVECLAPGHIRIDGRDVALGLLWQKRTGGATIRQQALGAAGRDVHYDLYAMGMDRAQIGLARAGDNHRARMLVGALHIETADLGDNWLAAFPLVDNGGPVWVIAMREGHVYEDSYHDAPESAQRTFQQLAGAPDWEMCIAPGSWEQDDAREMSLAAVFRGRPAIRLQPVNRVAVFAPWMIGAAGVGVACAVVWTGLPHVLDRLQSTPLPIETAQALPPPPWLDTPQLPGFAAHCVRLVGSVYHPRLGWEMTPIICSWQGQTVRVAAQWNRKGGSYARLRAFIEDEIAVPVHLACSGTCATLTSETGLRAAELHQSDVSWPAAMTESILHERFRDLGVEIRMTRRQLPGDVNGNPAAGVPDSYHDVRIDVAGGLADHIALLRDVPALVPEAMTFVPATGHWQVTARIYHWSPVSDMNARPL